MLITYLLIRLFTLPFAYLPYRAIHSIGRALGTLCYHLLHKFRKRALSNLALATDLHLSNPEIRRIAKESIQSLMITCLEYPKLAREKKMSNISIFENPEIIDQIKAKGKGMIFFCGHQANWELLFLEGTSRMPGVAIGRPIKNHYLYNWVQSIREKFGGTIITPKNAIKEGLRALKNGAFLGIVGDQGMPDSGYSSIFLGRLAWTSPMPAMLALKTESPIIVATTIRKGAKYHITLAEPIYPNAEAPKEEEIKRLMDKTLEYFQESVKACPEQWLWIHNRWKQQTLASIKRPYRQDSLALFFSNDPKGLEKIRALYPTENIAIYVPKNIVINIDAEIHPYTDPSEVLQEDYRYKLIVNFTGNPKINAHYKKLAAVTTVSPSNIKEFERMVRNA